jgi:DNA-binding response OmpR family regulator
MTEKTLKYLFSILLVCSGWTGHAQGGGVWRDSLQAKTKLLRELVADKNFEDAQLEAGALRIFLRQKFIHIPPATLNLLSGIYFQNKDRKSAEALLGEAEQDAQRDKNLKTKAALLNAIIREHERWDNTERANITKQLLQTAQDSLASNEVREKTRHFQQSIDSLQKELNTSLQVKENTFTIDRDRAYALAGIAGLILLALIIVNLNAGSRWRKKWENREMEWELRTAGQPLPMPSMEENLETSITASRETGTSAYDSQRFQAFAMGDRVMQIALVIESNRQIALYVRSLLSSNFDVETAATPAEALKIANEIMPDLIVCDTDLNGQAGIDIVRQIKLSDRTNHIPVVLLSRHHGSDGRLDALRAGADAWFTRPMQSEDFNFTVKQLIDGQKERHETFARFLQLYFTSERQPLTDRFLEETITHIEENLSNPDYLADDIARKMQMSNPLFVRKLRALTGKEPAQIMREMRLEKARYLLSIKAANPQTISQLVGFSNPGIFSMAFKDYFGENTMLLQQGKN